jgi:hypothetical protein
METLTIQRRTITVPRLQDLPRKKKKARKKAMRIKWTETPLDVTYTMKPIKT